MSKGECAACEALRKEFACAITKQAKLVGQLRIATLLHDDVTVVALQCQLESASHEHEGALLKYQVHMIQTHPDAIPLGRPGPASA